MNFDYNPPPVLKKFMRSNARVRAVRGPVGSAKTTACIMELFRRSCEAPIQADGVRRSRMVIVRNTLQQLKTTCLVSAQQLLRPVISYKVSDATIKLRMPGIESDWLLLPLDTEENIQRLLSLELTAAWISEFREIDVEIVQAVLSRCGRYPSRAAISDEQADYWYGLVMETNSFSEDSGWYEQLEVTRPGNWDYFVQPGAFEPNAENREFLPPSYYEDLMESNTPQWCEQYIHNKITPSLSGQAVFRRNFNTDFHVAKDELIPVRGYPMAIGLDTGRNPAATITQMDHRGRLLVLEALSSANMGMEQFLATKLQPALTKTRYSGIPSYLVLDPACRQRSQIGEESVIQACQRLGWQSIPAQTNAIEPRLRAVDKFLCEQRDGGPAILFDPVYTPELIISMQSKYRFKIKKVDKTLEDKPEKLHPWSDLCFVAGTPISVGGRPVDIASLQTGMLVDTPNGQQRIVATGSRRVCALVELTLSNGHTLRCTPNHPFVLGSGSIVEADTLQYGDILESIQWRKTQSSGSTENDTAATRETVTSGIGSVLMAVNARSQCTVMYGHTPTAQFQRGMWYITSTMTRPIMTYPTSSSSKTLPTAGSIWLSGVLPALCQYSAKPVGALRRAGTVVWQGLNGIVPTERGAGSNGNKRFIPADSAVPSTEYSAGHERRDGARLPASLPRGESRGWITKLARATFAGMTSFATSMRKHKPAVSVVGVVYYRNVDETVYNLTVENEHRYYAGSVLVLNCDSLQYACLGNDSRLRGKVMRANAGSEEPRVAPPPASGWT